MSPPIAPDPGHIELGRLAVELARGAAQLIVDSGRAALDVGSKSTATDLVTAVDRASERWLVEQLAHARPDDAVLGEEGAGRAGTSGVRWVLDPVDGTVNFVLGLPAYAVSVAAEVDGTAVAGAVCNPANRELFHAVLGGGSFLSDASLSDASKQRRLAGPRDVPLARAVIGTGFGYDPARRARQGAVVAALLPRIADIRRIGSAALDLCSVACGRLDGYFEVGLNPWDHAAGALIAAEAGCVVVGPAGGRASDHLVLAAGPALAADLAAVLDELGAGDVLA